MVLGNYWSSPPYVTISIKKMAVREPKHHSHLYILIKGSLLWFECALEVNQHNSNALALIMYLS